MTSMAKRVKEIKTMIQLEGCDLLEYGTTKSAHLFFVIRSKGKTPKRLIASCSPTDKRSDMNLRADVRRYVRGGLT